MIAPLNRCRAQKPRVIALYTPRLPRASSDAGFCCRRCCALSRQTLLLGALPSEALASSLIHQPEKLFTLLQRPRRPEGFKTRSERSIVRHCSKKRLRICQYRRSALLIKALPQQRIASYSSFKVRRLLLQ